MGSVFTRIEALSQSGRRLSVDRAGSGAIRGLSVITSGPALGHGFDVDDDTVRQVAGSLNGVPGRWTHGGLSEDGLARHLGRWKTTGIQSFALCRDCKTEKPLLRLPSLSSLKAEAPEAPDDEKRVEPEHEGPPCPTCGKPMDRAMRAIGDFNFTKSAHSIRPDGLDVSAPEYLMDRAEEDPASFGISIVAEFKLEERAKDSTGAKRDPIGRLAGPKALHRADFVADPAANPVGLAALHVGTGALSELSEAASNQLDRMAGRLGEAEARRRALRFLDRFFDRRKGMSTPLNEGGDEITAPAPTAVAELDKSFAKDVESLRAENAELRAAVKALKAAEDERKKLAAAEAVSDVRRKAVAFGSPIPETDLEKVTAAFARGDEDTAKTLAAAFLARSEALGVKFSRSNTTPVSLSPSRAEDDREIDEGVKKTLTALGVKGGK